MRLLHTSDWHLGAALDTIPRDEEHRRFFDWLVATVEDEAIDVLIVAGDVFDQAQPSAEAQRLYYDLLRRLVGTRLRATVIVGGNHDSAARLDAPREVLDSLSVHVVGGLVNDEAGLGRCIVPVRDAEGAVALVVLAVPFVHEYRLGVRMVGRDSAQILADFREHFRALYAGLVDRALAEHPGVPIVATGHLACTGSTVDDAPAEIHLVGSLGGLPPEVFDPRLVYVALGHVHRAYRVGEGEIHYSGTPIAFSRKEARPARSVRIVDVARDGRVASRALIVPATRRIVELEGEVDALVASIAALTWDEPLPPIVCATIRASRYDPEAEQRIRNVARDLPGGPLPLADLRTVRVRSEGAPREAPPPRLLAELSPEDVFRALCASREEDPDEELIGAFREALSASSVVDP